MDPNVTEQERTNAIKICRKHLTGAWKNVPLDQVTVCRVSGGMTNLLFYCALQDTVPCDDEPRETLLRIYGSASSDTRLQLEIFNHLAAENLGPKLYGQFSEGRLEEYLPSDPLKRTDMISDDVSAVVAQKIAAINKIEFKNLEKDENWLIDQMSRLNDQVLSFINSASVHFKQNVRESTKAIARYLLKINFQNEIDYISRLLSRSQAPLVFSHNDLHQNNIILLHEKSDANLPLDDRVVLIDFEYCSYNYRTFDIANHLSEWAFDYTSNEYPYFKASTDWFPSEQSQRKFLEHYIKNSGDNGTQNGHSNETEQIDKLIEEMKPLMMGSNLLWCIWAIKNACQPKIDFGYWEMAKNKWDMYCLCKNNYERKTRNGHDTRPVTLLPSKL